MKSWWQQVSSQRWNQAGICEKSCDERSALYSCSNSSSSSIGEQCIVHWGQQQQCTAQQQQLQQQKQWRAICTVQQQQLKQQKQHCTLYNSSKSSSSGEHCTTAAAIAGGKTDQHFNIHRASAFAKPFIILRKILMLMIDMEGKTFSSICICVPLYIFLYIRILVSLYLAWIHCAMRPVWFVPS